jgi:hypothetical protein
MEDLTGSQQCEKDQGVMGEFGKVEHQAGCGILDYLQGFDGTSGVPSQQRVAEFQRKIQSVPIS